ncbi:MAG: LamG domain-containing protein [Nocardioides sp.]
MAPSASVAADSVTVGSQSRTLNGTNVTRATDYLVKYTPAFGTSTRTNRYGFEAKVVDGKVTKVADGVGNMAIPSNGFVLSGHGSSRTWLRNNAEVGVSVSGGSTSTSPAPAPAPAPSEPAPAPGEPAPAPTGEINTAYEKAVAADAPTTFLQRTKVVLGSGSDGQMVGGTPASATLPNGDPAYAFNGAGQHLSFANRGAFSIPTTGRLTVEYWMRPDTLQFADEGGSGYAYVMGKGGSNAHEWHARMYSKDNSEGRPNRISGYAFNPNGGLGAGSYFQDTVSVGQWIHVALVFNTKDTSSAYPTGYVKIFKNGVLRDTDSLKGYNIVPKAGPAPLRIGTGYLNSYFKGAVGDVAFYDKELSASRLSAHYNAM